MSAQAETPQLTANLAWLLSHAAHNLHTELTAALEEVGLQPRAQCVLQAATTGEHTQIDIARRIGLDKTTMVVTVDELEKAGLAERRPSSTDRRARVIAVTHEGRRKLEEAEAIQQRVYDDVLAALPADQRDVFVAALSSLVAGRLSQASPCSQTVRRRT